MAKIVNVELRSDSLPDRSYPIYIMRGMLDNIGPVMSKNGFSFNSAVAVITNPLVGDLYADKVRDSLREAGFKTIVIEMPDGEEYKSLSEASKIYDRLIEKKFERDSSIIALGGGVVGDLAGFVAATYLRGVPYVQVPTTILSQVDSSIGGKTAVNHPRGKNLIGSFYQPKVVFIDPDVLMTLEAREIRGGIAEMIKHAVIRNPDYFLFLEEKAAGILALEDDVIEAIERSCIIKAGVVSADEHEQGLRAILNFGHTFGHAVESVSGYGTLRHGEAVAVGMVLAAEFSRELGHCTAEDVKRIKSLIEKFGLPTEAPGLAADDLFESMLLDKKVHHGQIRFVLLKSIGEVFLESVSHDTVRDFLSRHYR